MSTQESTVRAGRLVLGLVLVLAGAGWLLQTLGVIDIPWQGALAVSLVLVGLAILAVGRHGGLVTLGVVLTIILALASLLDVPFEGGIGERTFRPAAASGIQSEYRHAVGKLTVDLSDLDLTSATEVEISLAIGEVEVVVPADAAVDVTAEAGAGEIVLFGGSSSGAGMERTGSMEGEGGPLELTVSIGFGRLEVRG